jgi:hypothetical protein
MSRKNILEPYKVITDGDMSGDITSIETKVLNLDNIGIQIVATGTPTGNFTVEATIDEVTFTELTNIGTFALSGAGGSFIINLNQLPFHSIRVKWNDTSGTGVVNVTVLAKMI